MASELGMPMRADPFSVKYLTGAEQVRPAFAAMHQQQPQLELVLCIMPGRTTCYCSSLPLLLPPQIVVF